MNTLDSLAFCWRIERADGLGLALTSHDAVICHEGVDYQPAPGLLPSAVSKRSGLDPGSTEIDGAFSSAALTEEDLELGRWNGAKVRLTAVRWQEPDDRPVDLVCGEIGDVRIEDRGFSADLIGPAARLDDAICPATSAECRAAFGSPECGVDLAGRRRRAVVSGLIGQRLGLDAPVGSEFEGGRLVVVSGRCSGWTSPVGAVEDGDVWLRDAPPSMLGAGCRVWLDEGCDKRFETCRTRFANAVNFRGEPHLPGNDLLTRYPGG